MNTSSVHAIIVAPTLKKEEQLLLLCPVSKDNFWEWANCSNTFFLEHKGLRLMEVLSKSPNVPCNSFHREEKSMFCHLSQDRLTTFGAIEYSRNDPKQLLRPHHGEPCSLHWVFMQHLPRICPFTELLLRTLHYAMRKPKTHGEATCRVLTPLHHPS